MGKRRLEIEVETETIVLRGPAPIMNWCRECGENSTRITASQAGIITGLTDLVVYRMIVTGQLHAMETIDGRLQICLRSLSRNQEDQDVEGLTT
jgi:hypothetical protein